MGFKSDLKKEIENIKRDAQKELKKIWTITYEGHEIKVENDLYEERLSIDGELIDQKMRKSLLHQLMPFITLKGVLELQSGESKRIIVKLGGLTKLNCIIKIDGKKVLHDQVELRMIPWENKEPIVAFIEKEVIKGEGITSDALPDDEYEYTEGEESYTPGLSDFMTEGVTPLYLRSLVKRLKKQIDRPSEETRKKTYEKVLEERVASYGSELIARLKTANLDGEALQKEALWLLENAAHREIVKFALTLLSLTNCEEFRDKIYRIALHEEFTPYAINALIEGTEYANDDIFNIVQLTKGWGKLAALHALDVTSEDMRDWLIREGYKNEIGDDFLALTIARLAELDTVLEREEITKEVYFGAGEILSLLTIIPEEGIDAYPFANRALIAFLNHAEIHASSKKDKSVLEDIYEFLQEDDEVWEERYEGNWKPFERENLLEGIKQLIQKLD